MSREISDDFKGLKDFVANYELKGLAVNSDFNQILSQQHKRYFSFLTCISELIDLDNDKSLYPNFSGDQLLFIKEAGSDVGISLFVMTHGAYKASRMMLRSSIETFLKGFNLDEIPDLDKEKSVYEVFDQVKALSFFNSDITKPIFDSIHQDYKLLCLDTHTATNLNMAHVSALKYFPTFDLKEASKICDLLLRLVSNYTTLLCLKYNKHFLSMHHRNIENIITSIPKPIRPIILGVKE